MVDIQPRTTVTHQLAPSSGNPISAERYISPRWLEREAETLWPKTWLFACLERDVAEPGQYATFDIGRESILVSRTDDGELVAMFNVCQHRGARLVPDATGRTKSFVCPYHGWTYRRDGRLVVVPDHQRFAGRVDRAECSLSRVQVDALAGLVWICMEPSAPPLREFLGPVADRLAPFRVETMGLISDQTVGLACNWKAVFDNFGELYHVEHIHPQHEEMFDCPTAQIELFANGHTGVVIDGHTVNSRLPIPDEPTAYHLIQLDKFGADQSGYHGRVLDIRRDMQKLRRDIGPQRGWDYATFTDEQLTDIEQYNVFPNTMLTVQPDDAIVMRARPHPTDPNWCSWDKLTFHRHPDATVASDAGTDFVPWDARDVPRRERPVHDEFTQDDIIEGRKTMTSTIDQDVHLIRDVQAGMHSRGFTHQVLSDEEVRVQHYHDWLEHFVDVHD